MLWMNASRSAFVVISWRQTKSSGVNARNKFRSMVTIDKKSHRSDGEGGE